MQDFAERRYAPYVALVGMTNAGKSTLVNALFGAPVARVSAAANTTKEPAFVRFKDVFVIDMPGLGAGDRVTEERVVGELAQCAAADVIVHLVSATSGVSDGDRDLRRRLAPTKRLVTALNRVDLLDDRERKEARDGLCSALRVRPSEVVEVSAKLGTNLDKLVDRILDVLPMPKHAAFLGTLDEQRFTAKRHERARQLVDYYSGAAGVVALSPIPFSSFFVLAPLQVTMFMHLGRTYGKTFTRDQAASVIASFGLSLGARSLAQFLAELAKGIPFLGSVVGALASSAVAATSFYGFGRACLLYFEKGQMVTVEDVRRHHTECMREAQKRFATLDFSAQAGRYAGDEDVQEAIGRRERVAKGEEPPPDGPA